MGVVGVGVQPVRVGLCGVALDETIQIAASLKPICQPTSHCHAGKAKNQDQLESHPGTQDPKIQSSWRPLFW